eukprot:scaffold1751_cov253-Amphora_coffeaeformis.AAC.2
MLESGIREKLGEFSHDEKKKKKKKNHLYLENSTINQKRILLGIVFSRNKENTRAQRRTA